jgi:periplasmic divalent cation tolerance protein
VSESGELFASDVRLVLSTAPDAEAGLRLGRTLVEERLAACVNVVPGVRSIYRWREAIEEADEVLLVFKTTAAAAPALAARLTALHPYEVPEVLALEPAAGAEAFLGWIGESVTPPR